MKRIFVLFLILVLVISCLGCADDSSEIKGGENELSIYMLNDSQTVRKAIACYAATKPDMKINIEVGVPDYDTTVSDALKKLNTRMLAGDGPDIIVMDDIKAESYIESGQLLELSNIVDTTENLAASIAKNDEYGGKVYTIPFSVTLMADISQTGASIDFSSLGKFNESIKAGNAVVGSFDRQAALWYRTRIEPKLLRENEITEKELKTFYQDLYDHMGMIFGDDEESRFASFQQINLKALAGLSVPYVFFGKIGAAKEYIDTLSYLQMLCSMKEEKGLDFNFCQWQGETMYIPMNSMAISTKSHNREEAAALIKYLISEEGQQQITESTDCIPVNNKVLRSAMENAGKSEHVIGEAGSHVINPFTKGDIDQIFNLLNENSYSVTTDGILMEIIMQGAQDYLNGDISLDAATAQTLKKVGIYFAE